MFMNATQYTCNPYLRRSPNGLKYVSYAYVPYVGLYSDTGVILRGTEGQALSSKETFIPALNTPTPKVCCGQRGV